MMALPDRAGGCHPVRSTWSSASGRFAVSDVIADSDMDAATRSDMAAFTGCIAGALTDEEFRAALTAAGLTDIEIRETHRVHEHANAAIVRARKPDGGA